MPETVNPQKPLVIFDGECSFCRIWVDYFRERTGEGLEYAASQEVADSFPQIPRAEYAKSIQLVTPDGRVFRGARAVFILLTYIPGFSWLLRVYESIPGVRPVTESSYRFIASHRDFGFWLTSTFFGRQVQTARFARIEWLFLRALALVYLSAFASLSVQIRGLIGSRGVLPAGTYLDAARQAFASSAWRMVPTVFWFSHSDGMLTGVCIAGIAVSVILLLGFLERTSLVILFVLYLSLCSAGQDFLSFQWDMLLLESGFLAIFLGSSTIVVWLFRLLVFRLMFSSGIVKILSGDPSWHDLSAMNFHYFTQPIPTPAAWFMQQLPGVIQKCSAIGVFAIELVFPFFIILPRRVRQFGAFGLILLQVLILITGNYAFFNWLSIALCLFLFDDQALPERVPGRFKSATPRRLAIAVAILVVFLGIFQMSGTVGYGVPGFASSITRLMAPFGIVNSYGLFAVMTTTRQEITIQGSNDGVTWSDYVFRYKPGPLNRRPPWAAPHQPRLDWQMWFAALSTYRNNPWFVNFMVRLLEGSPDVAALLETNPFPKQPPKFVRAQLSSYQFTNKEEGNTTGNWWKAEPSGTYLPSISLSDVRQPRP